MEGRYTVCVSSRPAGGSQGGDGASEADAPLPLHMTEGLQHLRMMEGVSRSLPSSPLLSHQAIGVRPVRKLIGRGRRTLHFSLSVQTGSIQGHSGDCKHLAKCTRSRCSKKNRHVKRLECVILFFKIKYWGGWAEVKCRLMGVTVSLWPLQAGSGGVPAFTTWVQLAGWLCGLDDLGCESSSLSVALHVMTSSRHRR